MPTYGDTIGVEDSHGISHLPDGRRFYNGKELQPGDTVCRCGINKHVGQTPFSEADHIERQIDVIRRHIDDDIIADLTKQVLSTLGVEGQK